MSHQLLPNALSELFVQSVNSRKLTLADRYGLSAALCNALITADEKQTIDRLIHGVRRGHIQLVDELSVLQPTYLERLKHSFHPNRFNVDKFMNPVDAQLATKARSLSATKR